MAVAICQAWPANSQERPRETVRPVARPADPTSAKPSATPGGPTTRSLQTGAAGANESARPTGPDVVTLNFINADIEGVVKVMSEITGKNFVLDPRVKGTINIVSAKPMPRALAYDVFLSALRLQGFAAIEDGGIVKIVPEADAKLHPSPTLGPLDKARPGGDRIETRVFTLKYESAVQTLPILRPLIAPNNAITAYQNSNTLVITDYANNLQRLEKIIDSIDQPSGNDPVVIPLQYASAVDVAVTVNRLFAEASQAPGATAAEPTQRFTVVADARSNSLLARSGDPSRLARLRRFVAMLDSPTNAGGNIHVVYLKNAEAVKIAETLRAIYHGDASAAAVPRTALATPAALGASTPVAGPVPMQAAGAPAPMGANQPQAASAPSGIIQADAATNSIIITAPDAIYNNLRAALDKLDVRRAQVYVEALIAEVSANKAAEFGIQWQDLSGLGKTTTQPFGGTNFGGAGQNIIGISQNPATVAGGLNIGIVKGQVSIPGVGQILNLGVLARALETDANANILSTPTLLTLDNEEASIVIGQNVPFITGQYALSGAATTPTPFQTVERRDVGLTLQVKPQISEGGTVRLQIYQEVSSIQDQTNPAGVITNKRAVGSTILVDDGQIVVIGGLIQDTVTDGIQKVPVLGDIPLLGGLFRYKTRSHNKTNLMIFLRPTLVRDSRRADAFTGERYDYILGEEGKAKPTHDAVLPDMESPTLPPRTAPATRPTPPLEIEVRPYRDEGRN
jgi:general secretion pathway protein D